MHPKTPHPAPARRTQGRFFIPKRQSKNPLPHKAQVRAVSKRVCAEPGCPALTPAGTTRCTQHARTHDRQRGNRQQRGYNAAYDRERRRVKVQVALGNVRCWRCGKPISKDEAFDLGHDDNNRAIIRGAEHVKCNRATRGRREGLTPGGVTPNDPPPVPLVRCLRCAEGSKKLTPSRIFHS